ncbi:AbrB/MazE/SpoVT family DNA-binding domain-containing protein [Pseudomonas bubulae]|uniref:AbrB/MazE/SpoVT family DNA-binding domain-containing protein n=1 Tax=Pseudomonas bubulae TaxID=2316085 RepID=UPI001F2653A2|nr:AbrB/MazE/SpoVT family DNA-binding domain-containing protein [Pseudomonas bubulae]MCF3194401.1 AbrB/MazE/SpoVT family DNA-binding domain-containing protein [Pseudomonas bubulae]
MNPTHDLKSKGWTVTCQDAADGTGDMIVPFSDDLLSQMGLVTGDTLIIENQPDGSLTLTKTYQAIQG